MVMQIGSRQGSEADPVCGSGDDRCRAKGVKRTVNVDIGMSEEGKEVATLGLGRVTCLPPGGTDWRRTDRSLGTGDGVQ